MSKLESSQNITRFNADFGFAFVLIYDSLTGTVGEVSHLISFKCQKAEGFSPPEMFQSLWSFQWETLLQVQDEVAEEREWVMSPPVWRVGSG